MKVLKAMMLLVSQLTTLSKKCSRLTPQNNFGGSINVRK
jgi:hypothetical protein